MIRMNGRKEGRNIRIGKTNRKVRSEKQIKWEKRSVDKKTA